MTNKEKIKIKGALVKVKAQKENWGFMDRFTVDENEVVTEALKKQIPQKPIYQADGYSDGELVYDTWFCPNCDTAYEVDIDEYNYCPNCGQAIDWSEEGEQE